MNTETVTLKTGEQLTVKILHPPLLDYASKVGCWGDIREDLLGGQMKTWLFTPYFVGEIGGEVAGSMSYYTPTDTRDVGVVEFVQTAEPHRRKGIGSVLLDRLIKRFRADGGQALYLCTTNPIAGRLYEKHDFWYYVGDGMRYLTPDAADFDQTYLAFCGKAQVREATWGDLPRASVLYNHPEPRWLIKDYFTQCFRDTRFESHFVKLMKQIENQCGAFVVLENPKQRIVGAAVLKRFDTFYEQHVATLSFRVCPSYFEQAPDLLTHAVQQARDLSINTLQIYIADCDAEQKELVKTVGFAEEARLRNRLRHGKAWRDVLVYTLSLPETVRPLRDAGDYYGNRRLWQAERVASSPNRKA
ncbi:MAG: GNAT family N-acetyltransferase [Candidatus Poribacteria bacterium]|nr:GNAT family N-acetyltransferase [Candidatus Poribacteria bacterium]